MKLLIGAGMALFSINFIFNIAEGAVDIILRAIGATLLAVGVALMFTSEEIK